MTFVQATEITARFDPKVGKQSKDFLVQRVVLYQSTINIEGRHWRKPHSFRKDNSLLSTSVFFKGAAGRKVKDMILVELVIRDSRSAYDHWSQVTLRSRKKTSALWSMSLLRVFLWTIA